MGGPARGIDIAAWTNSSHLAQTSLAQAATEPSIDGAKPVCWIDFGVICTVIVCSKKPNYLAVVSRLCLSRHSRSLLRRGVGRQRLSHIGLMLVIMLPTNDQQATSGSNFSPSRQRTVGSSIAYVRCQPQRAPSDKAGVERHESKKTTPSTNDEARGKSASIRWLVYRTGGWGLGSPARLIPKT